MLSEREQQAHRVPGERAGGLRDEEGARDAAALRVGVVVSRRRAHPPVASPRAGALHWAILRRAAFGDAEDDGNGGLLGVAEREVAAISGRGGPAALARAMAEGGGSMVRRVALPFVAVWVRLADDAGDMPRVHVRVCSSPTGG